MSSVKQIVHIYLGIILTLFYHPVDLNAQKPKGKEKSDIAGIQALLSESKILLKSNQLDSSEQKAQLAYHLIKPQAQKHCTLFIDIAFHLASIESMVEKDSAAEITLLDAMKNRCSLTSLHAAQCYQLLANIKLHQNKNEESIFYIQNAITFYENLLPDSLSLYVDANIFLIKRYLALFQDDQALSQLNTLFDKVKNHEKFSTLDLKKIYFQYGIIYFNRFDYKNAIRYFEMSLNLYDIYNKADSKIIRGHFNYLGECYNDLLQHDKALTYFSKALDMIDQKSEDEISVICSTKSRIAHTLIQLNQPEQACVYFKSNMNMVISKNWEREPIYGWVTLDLGSCYMKQKEYQQALNLFQTAYNTFLNIEYKDTEGIASSHIYMGIALASLGQYEKAIQYFNDEITILKKIGPIGESLLYFAESEIASAYKQWYGLTKNSEHFNLSQSYFESAISSLIQQLKDEVHIEKKKRFITKSIPIIEKYIHLIVTKYDNTGWDPIKYNKVWELIETLHAYLLNSGTRESKARYNSGISFEELTKDSLLQQDITDLEITRNKLITQKKHSLIDTSVLNMNLSINIKKHKLLELRKDLESKYPNYLKEKKQIGITNLEIVKQQLNDHQTLVEYFNGDSSIYVFIVQKSFSKVISIPKDFALNAWIDSLQFGITGYYSSSAKNSELYTMTLQVYTNYASKLYEKLFSPIEAYVTSEIIFIPDDVIASIPMGCLLQSLPKDIANVTGYSYLMKKYQFQYNYSATMWLDMENRKVHADIINGVLAFAPFFENENASTTYANKNPISLRYGLNKLPHTGKELSLITTQNQLRNKLLFGTQAKKDSFLNFASQYRIIHLATHALADFAEGEYSFLAFYSDGKEIEKSFLTVTEIYNMALQSDLITLSACESALGLSQKGEGIISLARAFVYAGSKSIVATLWRVNDESTMHIMNQFYQQLYQGKRICQSLAYAQSNYLEQNPGKTAHPFFWAGFIPIGSNIIITH